MNMPAKSSRQEEEKNAGQNLAASQSGCQPKWLPVKHGFYTNVAASQTWRPAMDAPSQKGLPAKVVASQGGCQPKCVPAKMAASQTWLLDKHGCRQKTMSACSCNWIKVGKKFNALSIM